MVRPFLKTTKMEIIMSAVKYQDVAKAFIFVVLSLSPNEINADSSDLNELNLISPKKPSRPRQEWVDKKSKEADATHSSALTAREQRKYFVENHNEKALKYGHPEHIIHPHTLDETSTLGGAARSFHQQCIDFNTHTTQTHQALQALAETAGTAGRAVAQSFIDDATHDEKARSSFAQLLDSGVIIVKSIFG
jgi:hypothetical protein